MFPEEDSAYEMVNIGKGARKGRWLGWKRHSIKLDPVLRTSKLRLTFLSHLTSFISCSSPLSVRLISIDVELTMNVSLHRNQNVA